MDRLRPELQENLFSDAVSIIRNAHRLAIALEQPAVAAICQRVKTPALALPIAQRVLTECRNALQSDWPTVKESRYHAVRNERNRSPVSALDGAVQPPRGPGHSPNDCGTAGPPRDHTPRWVGWLQSRSLPQAMLVSEAAMTRKELQSLILKKMDELDRWHEHLEEEKIIAGEQAIVYEVTDVMARAGFHRLHAIGRALRVDENSEAVKNFLSRCLKALRSKRRAGPKGTAPESEILTPPDVARRYGVSPDTVRGWIASGDLRRQCRQR